MSIKFTKLTQVLVVATIASLFTVEVKAEKPPLHEAFKDAYFTKGQDAFQQSSIVGQINTIFGFTGFPEQHISTDAKKVHQLYEASLAKQTSSGEYLVTKDLENPYDTSLRENPSYTAF